MINKSVEPARAKDIAKSIVTGHLNSCMNPYALNDLYEMANGNKQILLGHIEALRDIFDMAIKEIKEDMGKEGNE